MTPHPALRATFPSRGRHWADRVVRPYNEVPTCTEERGELPPSWPAAMPPPAWREARRAARATPHPALRATFPSRGRQISLPQSRLRSTAPSQRGPRRLTPQGTDCHVGLRPPRNDRDEGFRALPHRTGRYRKEGNVCKGNLCRVSLLSAGTPCCWQGRGSVRGEPLRFPHSRSVTRPQATTFAQQKCRSKKRRDTHLCVSLFFGAGDEARTRYLDLGKVALYQMSYARKMVPQAGVEPATRGFSVRCSTN